MSYLPVSSLQLSFGPHCRLVSICNVVSCWRMPRTCESIARLKIEHKQRTKRCNLQHFLRCQMHSFSPYEIKLAWLSCCRSPRKWIKHCYLQGFVHVKVPLWKFQECLIPQRWPVTAAYKQKCRGRSNKYRFRADGGRSLRHAYAKALCSPSGLMQNKPTPKCLAHPGAANHFIREASTIICC